MIIARSRNEKENFYGKFSEKFFKRRCKDATMYRTFLKRIVACI